MFLVQFAKDHQGAIFDYSKAIEFGSAEFIEEIYVARGLSKQKIGDLEGACNDWKTGATLRVEDCYELEGKHCSQGIEI
tara:strand:- start:14 stop:250 length:237 start_codon:yes stop_codon:yes gene_type:complete